MIHVPGPSIQIVSIISFNNFFTTVIQHAFFPDRYPIHTFYVAA
jgi:hypothetical protein